MVTVLIPTWNPGPQLRDVIKAVKRQRCDHDVEILIIDSGSTDGTADLFRASPHVVRWLSIPKSEFNHGLTRDLGIREARGGIVVLLAQDALPADEQWLQRLVDCFADPQVAGAYSRQLPRADTGPFIRARLRRWMPDDELPRVRSIGSTAAFEALAPADRLELSRFDNVSSSVRREAALKFPFGKCRFGEDMDWARRVLLAGYKIVYEPRSIVIHAHDHSIWYEFKRAYLDHQNRERLFGNAGVRNVRHLVRASLGDAAYYLRVAAQDGGPGLASRAAWIARALPFAASQNLGQYLGARSVRGLERGSAFYRGVDRLLSRGV